MIQYIGIREQAHEERKRFHENLQFCEKAREIARVAFAGNSLGGHAFIAADVVSSLPKAALPAVGISSVFSGVLGVPIGLAALREGSLRLDAARRFRDEKGAVHSALWGLHGLGLAGVSSLLMARGIMNLAQVAVPAAVLPAMVGFGVVASTGALGFGAYGASEAMSFRKAFQQAQKGGVPEALQFLDRQINLLPAEICGKSEEQIAQDLQKKWSCLERKVGRDCARQIREELPFLLQDFDPIQAEQLIKTVDQANFKMQMRYITLLCAGIIGFLSFIALFLTSYPLLAPVLCMVGAMMMITVDASSLHKWIGEKLWAWHHLEKTEPELCPIHTAS